MKRFMVLFIVIALMGCTIYPVFLGAVNELGELRIIRDATVVIDTGTYPVGLLISGGGEFHAETTGGVLINGVTSLHITEPGEYWLIMDTSTMSTGDTGTIVVTIVSGDYYEAVGLTEDNYEYYLLNIEVN